MSQAQAASKTVLVIDDEPSVVTYIETLLQDNGYNTISAGDGEAGVEMARRQRPDLITLDITMPKKSGVGAYRAFREDELLAKVPVVIVTAVTGWGGDPKEFEKFISSRRQVPPPDGFVAKPFEEDELLRTVKNLIG